MGLDERLLAREIDRILAEAWVKKGMPLAEPATDAEFLRRVSLDVAGKIPAEAEAREFLDGEGSDKRGAYIDRILNGPAFPNHMAEVWKNILIPEILGDSDANAFVPDFESWLREQFAAGVGYDTIVRKMLSIPVREGLALLEPASGRPTDPTPFAFLAAKQGKPEILASSISRVFLGIRLECAQCHDHPFKEWRREQFWSLAAFFAGIELQSKGDGIIQGTEAPQKHDLLMPGAGKVVGARFLDGTEPEWRGDVQSRTVFSNWLTSPTNPYFARATANRIWSHFFGVGIVEPVDDMEGEPSYPELLDLLADQLIAHEFDLRYMTRAILLSRAYQLTSASGPSRPPSGPMFDRMSVRGMTPRQLYDSLVVAAGLRRESKYTRALKSPMNYFLRGFDCQETPPTERRATIPQALLMMNGELVSEATSVGRGKTLTAVVDAPFLDTAGKVESLYLAALTRRPRPEEFERLVIYIDRSPDPDAALADVFWSLLCSAEFRLIH